jgi:hypothetical protein
VLNAASCDATRPEKSTADTLCKSVVDKLAICSVL